MGQPLPELFSQERHQWGKEAETHISAGEKDLRRTRRAGRVRQHRLRGLQVDITEVVEPEVVQGVGNKRELSGEKASLTLMGSAGQAAQDPSIHGE